MESLQQPGVRDGTVCRVITSVFFFQAEDGIRDVAVTGVQTCALPILVISRGRRARPRSGTSSREMTRVICLRSWPASCRQEAAAKAALEGRCRAAATTPSRKAAILLGGNLAVEITMKELLEAGVHFGHQTRRWNPKMKEYIFGERNGIHIIDLQKTLKMFREASRFVSDMSAQGRNILFVGTKRQAQEAVAEEAKRCGAFYVNHRWLGGTLTNWATLQKSIKQLKLLKAMTEDGRIKELSKKEQARLDREMKHLHQNLEGIENMTQLPDAMFVIDSNAEEIAVKEA